VWPTLHAHRLAEWARATAGADTQSRLMTELFRNYHERDRSPADVDVLADAAAAVGLDRVRARRVPPRTDRHRIQAAALSFLRSDALRADVERASARWAGQVDGVPLFVFNDRRAATAAAAADR
jgi:predicted DsbA family dithiol-disulfide isomerase